MLLLSSADLFSKLTVSNKLFRNIIRVPNRYDPGQDRRFVGPDLDPNCLQRRFFFILPFACWIFSMILLSAADFFFKISFFKKSFRNTIRVGSMSGPKFCQSWSGSKLFAKVSEQKTKVAASQERVKPFIFSFRLHLFLKTVWTQIRLLP